MPVAIAVLSTSPMAFELTLGTSFVAALLTLLLYLGIGSQSGRPRPPGPPPKFLIGNLKDIPSGGYEWIKYVDMARKFGTLSMSIVLPLASPLIFNTSASAGSERCLVLHCARHSTARHQFFRGRARASR